MREGQVKAMFPLGGWVVGWRGILNTHQALCG